MKGIRNLLICSAVITTIAAAYFGYAWIAYPRVPERDTMLSEFGEALGEIGFYALGILYARTLLKLALGRGPLTHRLLPDRAPALALPALDPLLRFLDRSHPYIGIVTVALILLHAATLGVPVHILFFPAVLALVVWQGLFGMFLMWRYTPVQLKKLSWLVHAQLVTGVMIGVFAFFGHLLIDD